MKMNKTITKCLLAMSLGCFALTGLSQVKQGRVSSAKIGAQVALHFDRTIPQLAFAAREIERALAAQSVKGAKGVPSYGTDRVRFVNPPSLPKL